MNNFKKIVICAALKASIVLVSNSVVAAASSGDTALSYEDGIVASKIRNEGIRNSEVSSILYNLSDVIGARLTGSKQLKQANDWTATKLKSFGLDNVRVTPYEFGRGWDFSHSAVHMITPTKSPVLALPYAWTAGTNGAQSGDAMIVDIQSKDDFEKYEGKLSGKILFLDKKRKIVHAPFKKVSIAGAYRFTDEQLAIISEYDIEFEKEQAIDESPVLAGIWKETTEPSDEEREDYIFRKDAEAFFLEEGVLATVRISRYDMGLIVGGGVVLRNNDLVPVTALNMASEHYNRVIRLLENDIPVRLEIDVRAEILLSGPAHNTFAEIKGSKGSKEIVMVGAHLDSWHVGTGASDNGAGVAITMEAMRILKSLNIRPKRTIRLALWGGEEQEARVYNNFYLGSGAFADKNIGTLHPASKDEEKYPQILRKRNLALQLKEGQRKISAYYNIDNGSGRIRGIWAQDNHAAALMFRKWFEPFADLGANTVTSRSTYGTDHIPFDLFGIPGFQFIQDSLEYESHLHHTNMDVVDHASEADMKQAASILAFFLYKTSMLDEIIPRKGLRNSSYSE
ncbi:MAG: carboxypeptidase Q [Pseudohongiellaceae bacterium]|jgi:carboxypeptidase Q